MQSQTSIRKTRVASPKKSTTKKSTPATFTQQEHVATLEAKHQQLQFDLSDKDIEMDRLKTTVQALNEKCVAIDDIKQDCENHIHMFDQSEHAREQLQIHIKETAVVI